MAWTCPTGFPEEYWLPVMGAEAAARAKLLTALDRIAWRHSGHSQYLHWDDVKNGVTKYVIVLMDVFSKQACAAVRDGRLAAVKLDEQVENFFRIAIEHAYWGLDHEKIRRTWSDRHSRGPELELRNGIMTARWHHEYLARVAELAGVL